MAGGTSNHLLYQQQSFQPTDNLYYRLQEGLQRARYGDFMAAIVLHTTVILEQANLLRELVQDSRNLYNKVIENSQAIKSLESKTAVIERQILEQNLTLRDFPPCQPPTCNIFPVSEQSVALLCGRDPQPMSRQDSGPLVSLARMAHSNNMDGMYQRPPAVGRSAVRSPGSSFSQMQPPLPPPPLIPHPQALNSLPFSGSNNHALPRSYTVVSHSPRLYYNGNTVQSNMAGRIPLPAHSMASLSGIPPLPPPPYPSNLLSSAPFRAQMTVVARTATVSTVTTTASTSSPVSSPLVLPSSSYSSESRTMPSLVLPEGITIIPLGPLASDYSMPKHNLRNNEPSVVIEPLDASLPKPNESVEANNGDSLPSLPAETGSRKRKRHHLSSNVGDEAELLEQRNQNVSGSNEVSASSWDNLSCPPPLVPLNPDESISDTTFLTSEHLPGSSKSVSSSSNSFQEIHPSIKKSTQTKGMNLDRLLQRIAEISQNKTTVESATVTSEKITTTVASPVGSQRRKSLTKLTRDKIRQQHLKLHEPETIDELSVAKLEDVQVAASEDDDNRLANSDVDDSMMRMPIIVSVKGSVDMSSFAADSETHEVVEEILHQIQDINLGPDQNDEDLVSADACEQITGRNVNEQDESSRPRTASVFACHDYCQKQLSTSKSAHFQGSLISDSEQPLAAAVVEEQYEDVDSDVREIVAELVTYIELINTPSHVSFENESVEVDLQKQGPSKNVEPKSVTIQNLDVFCVKRDHIMKVTNDQSQSTAKCASSSSGTRKESTIHSPRSRGSHDKQRQYVVTNMSSDASKDRRSISMTISSVSKDSSTLTKRTLSIKDRNTVLPPSKKVSITPAERTETVAVHKASSRPVVAKQIQKFSTKTSSSTNKQTNQLETRKQTCKSLTSSNVSEKPASLSTICTTKPQNEQQENPVSKNDTEKPKEIEVTTINVDTSKVNSSSEDVSRSIKDVQLILESVVENVIASARIDLPASPVRQHTVDNHASSVVNASNVSSSTSALMSKPVKKPRPIAKKPKFSVWSAMGYRSRRKRRKQRNIIKKEVTSNDVIKDDTDNPDKMNIDESSLSKDSNIAGVNLAENSIDHNNSISVDKLNAGVLCPEKTSIDRTSTKSKQSQSPKNKKFPNKLAATTKRCGRKKPWMMCMKLSHAGHATNPEAEALKVRRSLRWKSKEQPRNIFIPFDITSIRTSKDAQKCKRQSKAASGQKVEESPICDKDDSASRLLEKSAENDDSHKMDSTTVCSNRYEQGKRHDSIPRTESEMNKAHDEQRNIFETLRVGSDNSVSQQGISDTNNEIVVKTVAHNACESSIMEEDFLGSGSILIDVQSILTDVVESVSNGTGLTNRNERFETKVLTRAIHIWQEHDYSRFPMEVLRVNNQQDQSNALSDTSTEVISQTDDEAACSSNQPVALQDGTASICEWVKENIGLGRHASSSSAGKKPTTRRTTDKVKPRCTARKSFPPSLNCAGSSRSSASEASVEADCDQSITADANQQTGSITHNQLDDLNKENNASSVPMDVLGSIVASKNASAAPLEASTAVKFKEILRNKLQTKLKIESPTQEAEIGYTSLMTTFIHKNNVQGDKSCVIVQTPDQSIKIKKLKHRLSFAIAEGLSSAFEEQAEDLTALQPQVQCVNIFSIHEIWRYLKCFINDDSRAKLTLHQLGQKEIQQFLALANLCHLDAHKEELDLIFEKTTTTEDLSVDMLEKAIKLLEEGSEV